MKSLRLFATFVALLSCMAANAEVKTGRCGENLTYTLNTETGVLKIEGSGAMEDYENFKYSPWYDSRKYILTLDLPAGLTSIGKYTFNECSGLTSVTIPNSVTSIGYEAFYR